MRGPFASMSPWSRASLLCGWVILAACGGASPRPETADADEASAEVADAEELVDAGLDEWLENGVVALEWAERAEGVLPDGALLIEMAYSEDGRSIRITARDSRGRELIRLLRETT